METWQNKKRQGKSLCHGTWAYGEKAVSPWQMGQAVSELTPTLPVSQQQGVPQERKSLGLLANLGF